MTTARPATQKPGDAPPQKRSLFSKPSWSKAQDLDSADLFRRSDRVFNIRPSQSKDRNKRRSAKQEKERAWAGEGRFAKRQRMSDEETDDDDDDDDEDNDEEKGKDDDSTGDRHQDNLIPTNGRSIQSHEQGRVDQSQAKPSPVQHSTPQAKSEIRRKSPSPTSPREKMSSLVKNYQDRILERSRILAEQHRKEMPSEVIDLDDEEARPEPTKAPSMSPVEIIEVPRPTVPEEESDPDEEFPELARKARERARQMREEKESETSSAKPGLASQDMRRATSSVEPFTAPTSSQPDPVVHILVTSQIPNTVPIILVRKLNQRLKDVRLAWIHRQGLSDKRDKIILTWRGKRLFDVTTCKGLGVTVDAEGNAIASGGDLIDETDGKLHMEAMNTEMFEAIKSGKSKKDIDREREEKAEELPKESAPEPEAQIRIVLKAKGYPDFKLLVKPSTPISKITNAFRSTNKIRPDQEVFLQFDGDRLEPQWQISNTEMADLDHVDVYVK